MTRMDDPDDWVWDFWLADDGPVRHLFFLRAPRSLGDPELRHRHASVGHATSTDLRTWTRVADALLPSPAPAFDDLAVWTGSVVRRDDGSWLMLHTGLSRADDGQVQRIGACVGDDLVSWTRVPGSAWEADPRWYERQRDPGGPQEHWRDPWLVRADDGTWHVYLTARSGVGAGVGLGVIGHATSRDLQTWVVQPPLSTPTGRFEELEVPQLVRVDGRWVLLFSCLSGQMPGSSPGAGGVWSVPTDGPGHPVDVARAVRLTSEDLYVGKVVTDLDGSSALLAFENRDADGRFRGGVVAPVPVGWYTDGSGLELRGGDPRWHPGTSR